MKAIIFDWGRTLHDPEMDALFPGVPEMLRELAATYTLALVSLAKSQSEEERRRAIDDSGIAPYFNVILVGEDGKEKMYDQALQLLDALPGEVLVVDDRTVRGIAWANKRGAKSIWFQGGKFEQEIPTPETGEPTRIVHDVREITSVLARMETNGVDMASA